MSPSPRGIRPEHIRPVPDVVEYEETTGFALDLMDNDGIDWLPVVSPGTGKLLGVVDRTELQDRCLGFHEPDRCVVRSHLRSGVPYCFETEPLDEDLLERSTVEPVVVVDEHLRPIGFLREGVPARGSIVAIDRDPDSRDIYEALLTRNGFAVETASSVDEVASRLGRRPPDLVLLEPGGEAESVRRVMGLVQGDGDPVPVLVVTSWVDQVSQKAVLEAGADQLLPKPVTAEPLEKAVAELLMPPDALEPEDGAGGTEDGAGGNRIAVVDDDDGVRGLVARLLRKDGYRVRTARNGSDGVALAAAWQPNLIVMDLVMPVLDGWNARRLLARGRSTADIPVLLATGSCEKQERDTVLEEGFCDLVRKPFTPEELRVAVRRALGETPVRTGVCHRPPSIPTDNRIANGSTMAGSEIPRGVPVGGARPSRRQEAG